MRIGIITFHRAHNYGAVLQCYALQQYLIQNGYDAEVIDYNNKDLWAYYNWRDREYEHQIIKNLIKLPIRLYKYLNARKHQILRYKKFVYFQEHILYLSTTEAIFTAPYDLILIGSDQVWNTSITHGLDPYYWGSFSRPTSTKVATYAASLRMSWSESQYTEIHKALKNLDGISVREQSLKKYINSIFPDLNVYYVQDPVFLLSQTKWKELAKKPKTDVPYAFFYQAETSDYITGIATEIANKHNLPLYVLSADQWATNSDACHSASPQEFLGWIINARVVITSSFHALAFCILFEKDFYGIRLDSEHDERLNNLISMFGLQNRLIDNPEQCQAQPPVSIGNKIELINKLADKYFSFIM